MNAPPESAVRSAVQPAVQPAVRLTGIHKSFGSVPVLRGISLDVRSGSLHALLGGNGSGKSTTLKILAGAHRAAPGGVIRIHGKEHPTAHYSPARARAAGLRFVHQDLGLVPDLTVGENFALEGGFPRRFGTAVDWRTLYRRTQEQLDRARVAVDARTPVGSLRPSDRTLVAIARALRDDDPAITLVLDEPTARLPKHEVDLLLQSLRECRERGQTIIYVSHRLAEVLEIADHVSVLRDGVVTADVPRSRTDRAGLIEAITGATLPEPEAGVGVRRPESAGPPLLRVRALSAGAVRAADLRVAAGEVVGVAGLVGSGRTSLLRALFGDLRVRGGSVELAGRPVTVSDPPAAMRLGIAMIPEDRAADAGFMDRPLWENICAAGLGEHWHGWRIDKRRERAEAAALVARYGVKAASPDIPFAALSGGNQQKAVLARWFRGSPRLLLLDEPTQGVDAAARADIHRFVRTHVADGNAALVASSDFEELAELCDRVIVLREGRTVAELIGAELTESRISQSAQQDRTDEHVDAP
ncbi:sugar ABC transporter ATP-binding protein [Streptomyces sp. NPDC002623]